MRYLVKARLIPGCESALLTSIADGTLGEGSIAGDEYLHDMQQARISAKGEACWVETCFCDTPLEEGHDRRASVRTKMERNIEVAVERVQVTEPAGVQMRGVPSDRERAREPTARGDESRGLGQRCGREQHVDIGETVVGGDRLKGRNRVELAAVDLLYDRRRGTAGLMPAVAVKA